MLPLSPITDKPGTVFLTCIGRIQDPALRRRLKAVKKEIVTHASNFVKAATSGTCYKLASHDLVGANVTKAEMISVYDHQMVPAASRGRVFYDKIMALAKHRMCPLCAHGRVTTLDHYMPKTQFPGLAVCPKNLLPSCSDCNKAKRAMFPHCASQQTLNPYYDDVDREIWLHARFEMSTPIFVEFYVEKPRSWKKMRALRVRYHFKAFKLAQVFSSLAAIELEDIKERLTELRNRCGPSEVKSHLAEEAASRTASCKNSWKAALYRALAASSWFCDSGCKR